MKNRVVQIALAALAVVLLVSMTNSGNEARSGSDTTSYSQFLEDVKNNRVQDVTIDGTEIGGERVDGTHFRTISPEDPGLVGDLVNNGVNIQAVPPRQPSFLGQLFLSLLPIILLVGVWIFVMRRMQGGAGGSGIMSIGKSRARQLEANAVKETLSDVAGIEEAREEVGEIVDFLKDPGKFRDLGGAIPRGVLMVGPPGTGKTLLARAIAGEASVPFFTASGSDFVEMFVGVGASRVRDLFKQAKEKAPCIIFVDEIDAVGRRRGAGLGGGHDEREQTLNQLLVEMDGFEGNEGVIVIAATNRPDVLDPALLRPGRFDRQVVVPLPDVLGREQILKLHMRKVPIGEDVKARTIARGTPGFSGADLANLVNEAALFAARANRRLVGMEEFERAKDKITMGAERRSMVMSEDDKRLTAYHEAGHTIVGRLVPEQDPVHKVSIIPRGRALGVTLFLPEQDRFSASKRRLESQITTLFGGRLAEAIIFGDDAVTTGAQNDIERATAIARDMVTKWGLTEGLGPLAYQDPEGEVFLGQAVTQRKQVSDETARQIDEEVRAIVERNYARARVLLTENLDKLHAMSDALMQYETLDAEQIEDIMAGREPRPPVDFDDQRGSGRRPETRAGARPRATGIPAPQAFVQEAVSIGRENARQERTQRTIGG
jgi:cell division protease FtsH